MAVLACRRSTIAMPKASDLPRARGGADQEVAAGEGVGKDALLDGERFGDAARGQRRGDGLGHAEVGEGLHVSDSL